MDRSLDRQPDRTPERRYYGCAVPGNSGRPSAAMKRAMIDAKARELAEGAFDRLSKRDRELLLQAADLLISRPRNGEDKVRRANAVSRLLGRVHGLRAASPRPAAASGPSLGDLMSGHR
jgi:hypothetical protein